MPASTNIADQRIVVCRRERDHWRRVDAMEAFMMEVRIT
jgi:hypothetical protein